MTMAKPIQIALIDDDEAVLDSLSLYFRSQQVATASFATAQDFLAALGQDKFIVYRLFEEIGPRYAERQGGYTRILKLGPRRSDATEMVFLELV